MKNWMQKYEEEKEKTYEDILNNKLNKLLDLVDNVEECDDKDMLKTLTNIVELYGKLKDSGYDFDEKDMILRKKKLAELKYEKLKREHMNSKESDSWNEFEKEEEEKEEER